jgi:glutamate/aspartate transport system substrate-binding protein
MRPKLLTVVLVATLIGGPVIAEDLTGSLKKIKDTGIITIGHRESSIPFSFTDKDGKVMGYTIDLCLRIADAVKTRIGSRELEIKLAPITASNRIPLIANGTIDLECGSTTNNLERQKVVAFSITNFLAATRFVSKVALNLKSVEDLAGKTVVSTVGTTNLKQISDYVEAQRHLGIKIVAAKDHAEAFRMVQSDQAAAFVMDDILLYSLVANAQSPSHYVISNDALSVEPYGIMLRRDDDAFKKVVDETMLSIYKTGAIYPLYAKWFLKPIPPNGVNLNVPMSASLKQLIEKPTDTGDATAYRAKKSG